MWLKQSKMAEYLGVTTKTLIAHVKKGTLKKGVHYEDFIIGGRKYNASKISKLVKNPTKIVTNKDEAILAKLVS